MKENARLRNLSLALATGLTAITISACGQQSQASGDSRNQDDQPETVIVYRDSTDQQDASNDSGNSGGTSTPTNTSSSTSMDDDADDNMQQTGELPQGFPIPIADDHEVQRVGETQNEVAVDLRVPEGQQAYDYYDQALQDEGFVIEESDIDNDSGNFDADIDFVSDQYDGSIDFSGDTVEIDYDIRTTSGSSNDSGSSQVTSSTQLPQGFPVTIPDGYEVQNVREGGDGPDDADDITVLLEAPDGQQALDAFNQSLQNDGFTIEDSETDNDSSTFEADIDFDSADYDGNIDINGNSVEIDLDNRNSGDDD